MPATGVCLRGCGALHACGVQAVKASDGGPSLQGPAVLVCTCIVTKASDFSLYLIKILLSWVQSSLLNELVSGSSLLAFLKVTLCSLLF